VKRLARYIFVVMLTIGAVVLLYELRSVLAMFVLSLMVAAAGRPVIRRLRAAGLPRTLSVWVAFLLGLVVFILLLAFVGNMLVAELQTATNDLARTYERLYPEWAEGTDLQQAVAARLPPPEQLYEFLSGQGGEQLTQRALGLTQGLVAVVGGFGLSLILSIYWSVDQVRFERLWLSLLAPASRLQAREIWRASESEAGLYIQSQVAQSLMALALLGVSYSLLQLQMPVLLATVAALASLVPVVGSFLALPLAFVAGLQVGGLGLAAAAALLTTLVLLALEYVIEPRLFRPGRYNPILTVTVMLLMVQDFGLVGLIVAPLIAAAIQIVLSNVLVRQKAAEPAELPEQVVALRQRLDSVRDMMEETDEERRPEIESLAGRLSGLLERTTRLLGTRPARSARAATSTHRQSRTS
jgi:predicted PurR-regulated permease PerM